MNVVIDWNGLCQRAQAEAERYTALHPLYAEQFQNELDALQRLAAPADEQELMLRRFAIAGLLNGWHRLHVSELLGQSVAMTDV